MASITRKPNFPSNTTISQAAAAAAKPRHVAATQAAQQRAGNQDQRQQQSTAGHSHDQAGGQQPGHPSRAGTHRERNRDAGTDDIDTFVLTPADGIASINATQDGNLEITVRGTRASDGSSGQGVVLGQGAIADQATTTVSSYGLTAKAPLSAATDGGDLRVAVDRSSVLAGGATPLADGGKLVVNAGVIANIPYASATIHDDAGNAVGPGLMTTGGGPGVGLNYSHATAVGGVAVAALGLADKVQTTEVLGLAPAEATAQAPQRAAGADSRTSVAAASAVPAKEGSANAAAPQVAVAMRRTSSAFGQLVLSGGGHGIAGVARLAGESKTSKRYQTVQTTDAAAAGLRQSGTFNSRLHGLMKRRNIPSTDRPQDVAPGATLAQDRSDTTTVSAGVSIFGSQFNVGRIQSQRSFAEVTRKPVDGGDGSDGGDAGWQITVGEETGRTHLFAGDFPLLASASMAKTNSQRQSFVFDVNDENDAKALLTRKATSWHRRKGHYRQPAVLTNERISFPQAGRQRFAALRETHPNLSRMNVVQQRGGQAWRVALLPLPSSLLGPKAGASFEREVGREVVHVEASAAHSTVVRSVTARTQYELPMVGQVAKSLAVITVTTNADAALDADTAATSNTHQTFVVDVRRSYSHAGAKTMKEVAEFVRTYAPEQLPRGKLATNVLDKDVALTVAIRFRFDDVQSRAFGRAHGLVASGVPDEADGTLAEKATYQKHFLTALQDALGDGSSEAGKTLLANLGQFASVQVRSETPAIDRQLAKATAASVKANAIDSVNKAAVAHNRERIAKAHQRLNKAQKMMATFPFDRVDAATRAKRIRDLTTIRQELQRARSATDRLTMVLPRVR